jgi:hypothetical protein
MPVSRSGPTTKDTTTVALGLAQIRVGQSAPYIGQIRAILAAADSVGALAATKFMGNAEYFKLESGYPLLEDAIFPLREAAALELSFKEITPSNLALARGLDPTIYTNVHLGEIPLGSLTTPVSIRMEAVYTYPDGTNTMTIIFPRAQVSAPVEMDLAIEDIAAVPITIESKRADGDIAGGHVIWNGAPLGKIVWDDGTQTTTTSTSSTTS